MSNYVPHYTKKRNRLHNLEVDLYNAMLKGDDAKSLKIAEEVRLAQIRVFKSEMAQISLEGSQTHNH